VFVLLLCDVHLYYVFILSVSLSSESADDSDDVNDHFRPGKQNVQSARVLLLSLLWGCEEEIVRKKLDRFPKKRRRGLSLFFSPLIDRACHVKFKNLSLCCHFVCSSLFLFASQICLKRSTSSSVLSLSLSLSK
jgi:hypothetical protein